jgi:hypothetical protein
MGLLTHFSPSLSFVNHGIQIYGVDFLVQLVGPLCLFLPYIVDVDVQNAGIQATLEKAIAVGIKCCWCGHKLASLLGNIKLPRSFTWGSIFLDSSSGGVDIAVLQALENDLWGEMKIAINRAISRVHRS